MEFRTHRRCGKTISEACGDGILVASPQDALDLMMESGATCCPLSAAAPPVYPSRSLRDFIRESNRETQVVFAARLEEALERLSRD